MEGSSQTITTYESPVSSPINIYRVKEPWHEKNTLGWIILSFVLAVFVIILLLLWVFYMWNDQNISSCNCYGPYGLQLNLDGNALMQCGTGNNQTCTFIKNSISDCVSQCDALSNICQAFTFNALTSTMKIVQPNNLFFSSQTNVFIRQSGMIS